MNVFQRHECLSLCEIVVFHEHYISVSFLQNAFRRSMKFIDRHDKSLSPWVSWRGGVTRNKK